MLFHVVLQTRVIQKYAGSFQYDCIIQLYTEVACRQEPHFIHTQFSFEKIHGTPEARGFGITAVDDCICMMTILT